MPPECII